MRLQHDPVAKQIAKSRCDAYIRAVDVCAPVSQTPTEMERPLVTLICTMHESGESTEARWRSLRTATTPLRWIARTRLAANAEPTVFFTSASKAPVM